jgi:hypothetical protein
MAIDVLLIQCYETVVFLMNYCILLPLVHKHPICYDPNRILTLFFLSTDFIEFVSLMIVVTSAKWKDKTT